MWSFRSRALCFYAQWERKGKLQLRDDMAGSVRDSFLMAPGSRT